MKTAFDKLNNDRIQVVLDEDYPADVKDFKTYLAKLDRLKNVDAIMIELLPGQCGTFAKQARQMGINLPLFGFEMFEEPNEVKASEGALIGQWYVNTDDADETFISEFRKRFPNISTWAAPNGHDTALLLGTAVDKGYNGTSLHEFLANLKDFHGALGIYSATGDNRFTLPGAVKVVTKTGFEKLYK